MPKITGDSDVVKVGDETAIFRALLRIARRVADDLNGGDGKAK
jgi:hypothetical protein